MRRTRRYSLWLGIISGAVFALSLWAYEAVLLAKAHVAYPWLPLVLGTILCILITTAAALLTHQANRAILGVVFWVVAAVLIAEAAISIPLKIAPALMKLFEPELQSHLPSYPITEAFKTWVGFGIAWLAIFFAILGILQITLVEQAAPAGTLAGRLLPYFIFVPIVAVASIMSSNQINTQLRLPLLGTGELIQFAAENQGVEVDPALARQMHLNSVNTIPELIGRPYRLFLGEYDSTYWQVKVLVDFDGQWAACTAVIGQVTMCKPLDNP